jgi:dephospho-CoA kinase
MSRPYLIGLTGSIGMGKTETGKMFARLGIPVFDADASVHRLYERGGAVVEKIGKEFPSCVVDGKIDRKALASQITGDPQALQTLEHIVHPLVAEEQRRFLLEAEAQNADMIVLDIPLLFETQGHEQMDAVVVVSAPAETQRARVLSRTNMNEDQLDRILERQMPDAEKRAKAHFVVETGKGFEHAFEQVKQIVAQLREWRRKGGAGA